MRTIYITDDGKHFTSEYEAKKHEKDIEKVNIIKDLSDELDNIDYNKLRTLALETLNDRLENYTKVNKDHVYEQFMIIMFGGSVFYDINKFDFSHNNK